MSGDNFRRKRTSLSASGFFLLKLPLKAANFSSGLTFFRRNTFAGLRFRAFRLVHRFREGPAGWARRFHWVVDFFGVAFVGEIRVYVPSGRRKSHAGDADFLRLHEIPLSA